VDAPAASFTASLDRDTVTLGESATLSLTFEGGQSKNVPMPDVPGLQIVQNGTSQSMSIVNGAMSSTLTVTFSVTPRQAGKFTIPSLMTDVSGQPLATTPLTLIVTATAAPSTADANSGNEVAFMKLVLPRQPVYVGEVIVGQVQLCFRDDVQNIGNFRFTSTPAEGFSIGKMAEAQRREEQIGNHAYHVIPISVLLTATKTGNLSLGPFTAGAVLVLPSSNQRTGDPFFNQFFNPGEQKQVSLATEQINVQSLPLPAENVPANFNGAIGDYTMTVGAGPTNLAVGDPITVRVQISGRGALDTVKLPEQPGWDDFKLFPPTSKTETSDQLGLAGAKTFEEIVTPQNTDVHALPEFSFSFFNPDDEKYHTLTQPPLQLVVRSAGATPMPTIAANKNSANENQTPLDILPIRENLGTVAPVGGSLVTRPLFLAAQTLPVLAFLAAFVWRKRADTLANNPRLRRKLAVEKLIQNGIGDLKKFAAENDAGQFFATLFRLLQEQLGERLDCPASAITEAVVDERLARLGASPAALESLRELFQLCNQARYAPVRGTSELNAVTAQFERVASELQGMRI
jgi:hypothetical protein